MSPLCGWKGLFSLYLYKTHAIFKKRYRNLNNLYSQFKSKAMTVKHFFPLLLLSITLLLGTSCKDFLKKQTDAVDVKGLLNKTQPELDTFAAQVGWNLAAGFGNNSKIIAENLLLGLKGSMDTLDPDYQKLKLKIEEIGNLSDAQIAKLGTQIESRIKNLKADIQDEEMKSFLIGMIEESTGKLKRQTQTLLSDMIQSALDEFDTETAQRKIQLILHGALGDSTRIKAQLLVSGALQPTVDTILSRIEKIVHKDLPFVQRQAQNLLLAIGAIAAAIIGWVWYQRRRYAKLVALLTYNIHNIPSQELYDELTKRIQNDAQKTALEPLLREVLREQGINEG